MKKFKWMYISVLCVLTLTSFWRFFDFTFWKDDWFLVWGILHDQLPTFRQFGYRPATMLEFYWMVKIFGTGVFPWQVFGLFLRVGASLAFSFFAAELTGLRKVGLLSGLLAAGTVIGMDAVGWPSAHGMLISSIFLLLGFGYFARYLKGSKDAWLMLSILYLGIAFISDPFRMFPLFFMIPLLLLPLTISVHRKRSFKRIIRIGAAGAAILAVSGWLVFRNAIMASQLFSHLAQQQNFIGILKKSYVIGNYFNSMSDLMFGWLVRFPEDASTGLYNRVVARLGFFIFCVVLGTGYGYLNTKSKRAGIVLFSLLWMFVFYIPDWLFEPRLTMGVTHRYMMISGFGFLLAVAYGLVSLHKRPWMVAGSVVFIVSNIIMANYRTGTAAAYRSGGVVSSLWRTIDSDVTKRVPPYIFVFEGDDPIKTYALDLSGPSPFALLRGITNIYDMPIVTGDRKLIQQLLCEPNVVRPEPGAEVLQKEIIPLNHVYAWRVSPDGTLVNISLPTRRELLMTAMDGDCVPMID